MSTRVEKLYLPLLLIASFIIRLTPHRTLLLAAYDEYLHKDITLRLVERGMSAISKDIPSLLGLKAYSYPPLFHILGAIVYKLFPSDYVFFILPAIYGTIAVFGFYLAFKELVEDGKRALLATALLAFAPNFIYRTSLYIPENLGLVMFSFGLLFLIKLLKTGRSRYLMALGLLLGVYMLTHRGWIFFVMAATLIVFAYLWPVVKRNLHYFLAFLILAYVAYLKVGFINSLVADFFLRLQKTEVSFLGYFKWIGVVQLVFGALGTRYYLEKDPIRRGFALWAWAFILAGGISFRFRDPYATIPLAAMSSEFLMDEVFPRVALFLRKSFEDLRGFGAGWIMELTAKKGLATVIIVLTLLVPLAQGTYGAFNYITPPTVSDREAYQWIAENTSENATILVWWDMGYLLIGNTHRKDVVIWKKVYQGFFGEAPTAMQASRAYGDHVVMFSSSQRERVYFLMRKYNVSYVFVDRTRLGYGLIRYGLMEYAPYDTHFKLEFCNGNAQIYRFVPEPPIKPGKPFVLDHTGTYGPLVEFLEKFWTGYNYADFDDRYKAYFNLNAWMVDLYMNIYNRTGDDAFRERAEWLLQWLAYKQMDNGAFPWGVPPNDFTLYTAYTLEPLRDISFEGKEKSIELLKSREREDYFMTTPKDKRGSLVVNAMLLPIYRELGILNETTERNVLAKILDEQREDGSWNDNVGTTVAIASGLARYYQLTGNETVLESIKNAAGWLMKQQDENGKLKAERYDYAYSRSTYAQMLYIYHVAGFSGEENKTVKFIFDTFNPNKEVHPLDAVLAIYRYLSYAYGQGKALDMTNELLSLHPLVRFD